MRPVRSRLAGALTGGVALAVLAGPLAVAVPNTAPTAPTTEVGSRSGVARGNSSLAANSDSAMEMVLDSSGSMADEDGSGKTRIASAREAVGTVVDSLPDGFPTGLRVYGADKAKSCTDTRLAQPVEPLDRAGIKKAVAAVEPKGDTPIGYSLKKAAADLPKPPHSAIGRRTILLISDGEDNCGAPKPCDVAKSLSKDGIDLRIDAIGFQVKGAARKQLKCVAEAGHGKYYDAPDADDLARELERAGRLSADGYRFKGTRVTGTASSGDAPALKAPGQYVDTIGPEETRWYAAHLDGSSATDLAATGVPTPGVRVGRLDGLKLTMRAADGSMCGSDNGYFWQDEGAAPVTTAVSRIPREHPLGDCDRPGSFTFELKRESEDDSDQARWPVELRLGAEKPLKKGVTPARAETSYGAAGKDSALPAGGPKDIQGGTGFNDAKKIGTGVWRDTLLPAQTRWYRVPVGWHQQLRYDVEFANEPKRNEDAVQSSYVWTTAFAPGRLPLKDNAEFSPRQLYRGDPVKVSQGTVPVSWNNRAESSSSVKPVRRDGTYYLAVTLGADAAQIAENAAVRIVLRVGVKGKARTGPEHDAPLAAARHTGTGDGADDGKGGTAGSAAGEDDPGPHPAVLAGAGAAAVLVIAGGVWYALRRRGRVRNTNVMRGGTW
ncbi:VWA domain-containing protein [Streptomyces sp. NBC_01795]|uniref:vWA domain-containing protein n=1 Tax=unclassified Streptomyces TaxID=2593676 RepID=UPI002DD9C438|nr:MULTISPECIES: VWA domain-containing protein [unclassified Streptomyces]WSA93621.1 VWA domain-containing protein [Streptomyces sp. NBC_01795]WSB77993.1 VWA domain-containing protein [Streptomyces sp. NBC_01775]WSS13754.1 VWA domain-containing protein [Streptomyces sp. NBC_01186]